MRVREARHADRRDGRARLLAGDERLHGVPERPPDRRAGAAHTLVVHELVGAVTEPLAQRGLPLLRCLPRKKAAVDDHLAQRRNHVAFLRGGDHRRRHGHPEQRLEQLGGERRDAAGTLERLSRRRDAVAEDRRQERLRLGAELRLDRERAQPLDEPRRLDERVVGDRRHRRVPAPSVHAQPERRAHLLRRRAQVQHATAELDAVACALVDREVGAARIRMLAHEPLQPEVVADLLVRGRGEDQVAGRLEALARERRQRDRVRRDLPLHVERTSTPDLAVAQLAAERVRVPLRRVGEHDVRVREERERGAAVRPAHPRDEVRPVGHVRVQLALDPRLVEVRAQELRGGRLVAGRIRRVDADQLLEEPGDLAQRRLPSTSR